MNLRAVFVFLFSVVMGVLILIASPSLTGHVEPWDASWPYYSSTLFITGAVLGLIERRSYWLSFLGVFLGQILFGQISSSVPILKFGPFELIGAVILGVYTLPCLAGSALTALISRRIWKDL